MSQSQVRKWAVWMTAGLAAALCPLDAFAIGQSGTASTAAAVVNGETIPLSEVDAALPGTPDSHPAAELKQLRSEALELIIDDVLMRQFLARHAPKAPTEECEKEFQSLLAGLKAKKMSLADYLRESKQSQEQLRAEIVKKLQWEKYVKQQVTEEALKRHFDENRDVYDRVSVQASHILLRLSPSASDAEKAAARARLLTLRQDILSGKIEFGDAARKHSQCQSALRNGDIGFFPRKWAVDERLAKAAFSLPVGTVSEIVQSDCGLHLVKITARKPGKPASFDAAKDEVRKNYVMDLWQDIVSKQRQTAKIEIKLP